MNILDRGIYWLPKKIAERPSAEAPGPRREEEVDEHPRPRNNAGTGVSGPESESRTRAAALAPSKCKPLSQPRFGNYFWQSV